MNQNIETVKQMYAAFSRGDVPSIMAHLADDVVWGFEANDKLSWAGIRHGKEDALGFFTGLAKDLVDHKLEMTEFLADGDVVASFGHYSAAVRKNGIVVHSPVAHYFRFHNGKVVEYRNFANSAAFSDAMSTEAASA